MSVRVAREGKTIETAKADPAEIKAVEIGAMNLLQEAFDNKLSFLLGVFRVEDGTPGVILTGHGSPSDMILMAESLVDKAERTRPPMGDFLGMLQDIFGDNLHVIREPADLENPALNEAMEKLLKKDTKVPAGKGPMTDPFADQNS